MPVAAFAIIHYLAKYNLTSILDLVVTMQFLDVAINDLARCAFASIVLSYGFEVKRETDENIGQQVAAIM